jgi:N utilization substance protein B
MASRHLSRSIVMQSLYEWDFYGANEGGLPTIIERNIQDFGPGLEDLKFVRELAEGVIKHKKEIDNIIEKAAPEWPISQIPIIEEGPDQIMNPKDHAFYLRLNE